jgi:hypothetical protein
MQSYTTHDPDHPDSQSQFTCAMVDHFTLENMILHGTRDGLAADSSWRNKSENRAAVTFIAVDENKHLLPGVCESHLTFVMYADRFRSGSVLLSANVRTSTLVEYLEATKQKVKQRAEEIIKGTSYSYRDDVALNGR